MLFFKQKTAYERRISDWSADVCASDLLAARQGEKGRRPSRRHRPHRERCAPRRRIGDPIRQQRRRARQQERGADRHPHLWPCRARSARERLYEDHQHGAGGALTMGMAKIKKGDTVVIMTGKEKGKDGEET